MLTSGEVQQLLEARGHTLVEIPAAPLDAVIPSVPDSPHLYGIPGGSGGASSRCSIKALDAEFCLADCLSSSATRCSAL